MFKYLTLTAVLLSGCAQMQDSSGAEYLAATPAAVGKLDLRIVRAASVEPLLRFPARIGLARVSGSQITSIPDSEEELWKDFAAKHKEIGRFVPVSSMIAESIERQTRKAPDKPASVLETIRLGAARQHLDAVLVYKVSGTILPGRAIKARGEAQALLVDVRNAYPYGTAQADADVSRLTVGFGSYRRRQVARAKAIEEAVESLVPEVEEMMLMVVAERAR